MHHVTVKGHTRLLGRDMKTSTSFMLLLVALAEISRCSSSNNSSASEDHGNETSDKPLYLLTLLPYPDSRPGFQPSWEEGLNIIPAMELAARQVNQRQGFLDGYELKLLHEDGGCDISTKTFTGIASLFSARQIVLGTIGPGCSASTLASLPLLNRTSLIAVHGAGSPEINRTSFPNSFGTYGSATGFVDVTFALMRKSGWRRLGLFTDPNRPFFDDTVTALKRDLRTAYPEAEVVYSSPVYDFFLPVADIKDTFVRVVFVFTGPELARKIMCIAFHEEIFYPAYQWVIMGRTLEEFVSEPIEFYYNNELYNCSTDDLARVLEGNFLVNFKLFRFEENQKTFSGISYQEYLTQYNISVAEYNSNSDSTAEVSIWATYLYDAVWAWAVVLDNVTKFGNFSIEEYQFDQPNDALIEQFEQVDFEGVSGRIKFDRETGSVDRFIDIFLISNATEEYVAYCNAGAIVKLSTDLQFVEDVFIDVTSIYPATAIITSLIVLIQATIIIATHIVVVVYRNFKSIKATSPKINHLAYVGAYFLIIGFALTTTSYSVVLDDNEARVCQAVWAFFFPYGFTLAFGTAAVRTWRLYRIFNHYLKPGRFITEPSLFGIVLFLLSVDIVVSVVWTTIDPFIITSTIDASEGVIHQNCDSNYYFAWLVIIMGYRLVQILVLLVLACLTRNITNKSFQTVTLQVLVYGTTVVFGLGATLYYFSIFLRLNINIVYVILGGVINALLLLYLSCVFMPPMIPLIKHKWKDSGYELKTRKLSNIRLVAPQTELETL